MILDVLLHMIFSHYGNSKYFKVPVPLLTTLRWVTLRLRFSPLWYCSCSLLFQPYTLLKTFLPVITWRGIHKLLTTSKNTINLNDVSLKLPPYYIYFPITIPVSAFMHADTEVREGEIELSRSSSKFLI